MKNTEGYPKRGVVYTCITANYDELYNHSYIDPFWDYVCYTDDFNIKNPNNSLWQIRPLIFCKLDDFRNQRWHKMHPHLLFPEYEKSIWIDGNVDILEKDFFNHIDKAIRESRQISIPLHPNRDCIYEELTACINLGKDDRNVMEEQIGLIRKDGFPEKQGLFDCSIIYMDHHDEQVRDIMENWWWWVEHYSRRDQLSLTYVLWKKGITIKPLSDQTFRYCNMLAFRHGEKHLTKEELIVNLQHRVKSLMQEIEAMKSSKFWKIREIYIKTKSCLKKF